MNNKYRVFICTHKEIPFDLKKIGVNSDHYTILSNVKGIESDCCDVIDISDDDFVKAHRIGYGELCSVHYLYTHQELIEDLDYIGICHYRRFYKDLLDGVDIKEDILTTAARNLKHTNYSEYCIMHNRFYIDLVYTLMYKHFNKYYNSFIDTMSDTHMHHCNMVVLPKHLFFEYCEFMFGMLGLFDDTLGIKNDEDTHSHIKGNWYMFKACAIPDMSIQVRIQGIVAERLTDVFIREKSNKYSVHESKILKLFNTGEFKNTWENSIPLVNDKEDE